MTEHRLPRARKSFDFADPWSVWEAKDPILGALADTPAYRRLKHVRFLGGIDYLLVRAPNGAHGNIRHTRFSHSLGVARLALMYADLRNLSAYERRHYGVAALLHDIGHAPLSHSLEPIFQEVFGLDHHIVTRQVIHGEVRLGRKVYEILRESKIDLDRIDALISGTYTLPGDNFFDGPINFDTIEGILRSQTYGGKIIGIPSPEEVVKAATLRRSDNDMKVVDRFWRYKHEVYSNLINSPLGVLADLVCQVFMRRNLEQFRATDFLSTEPRIFLKLPGLRALLTSRDFVKDALDLVTPPTKHVVRNFAVDSQSDFFKRDDLHRYVQDKKMQTFRVPPMTDDTLIDLFGGDAAN